MATNSPLGDLIGRVKRANRWSDQDICDNAAQHGHKLVKQTLSDMRLGRMSMISPRAVRAVADGLGISVNEVVRVALAQLGLTAYRPDDWAAEEAVRADAGLNTDTKEIILRIIAAARSTEPANDGAQLESATHYDLRMAARVEPGKARQRDVESDSATDE